MFRPSGEIQLSAGLYGHLNEWSLNPRKGSEFFHAQAGDYMPIVCEELSS
jgi:hypothetical protein